MTLGHILLIYFGGVILLILFGLLVISNFIRYRFKGDKTFTFIIFTSILFFLTVTTTILLTRTSSSNSTPTLPTGPTFFQ